MADHTKTGHVIRKARIWTGCSYKRTRYTDPFRKRLKTFSVDMPRTECSFVRDFIALEIMASELVALHDDSMCRTHALVTHAL